MRFRYPRARISVLRRVIQKNHIRDTISWENSPKEVTELYLLHTRFAQYVIRLYFIMQYIHMLVSLTTG